MHHGWIKYAVFTNKRRFFSRSPQNCNGGKECTQKKRPSFHFITELSLSPRVIVLLLYEGIYSIDQLKRTIRNTNSCKTLLRKEDFEDEDFFEIFAKLEWWYRMISKRKDPVFRFITELGLSPRVTTLLLYQGISTIDKLRRTVNEAISLKAPLEIDDFKDEDFFEIFNKTRIVV